MPPQSGRRIDKEVISFRIPMANPYSYDLRRSVRVAIESVGAKVKFLPPYSPDLSPIELCCSKLKQFLRSCEARTLESLDQAMTEAADCITEDDTFGWFHHCGLFT
ncbi:transposase [Brasilonema sp. CT11]|nr:transposase [Brasilonema sp. CT11]